MSDERIDLLVERLRECPHSPTRTAATCRWSSCVRAAAAAGEIERLQLKTVAAEITNGNLRAEIERLQAVLTDQEEK